MSIKRVAMYIRVSSDKQAQEWDSIPAQRDALQKYISDHGDMVSAGEYLVDNIGELVGKVYIDYDERKKKADGKAAKIAALEEKIERLKTLYVEGLIDIEEYKHDKALYLGRIADLSSEVDKPPRIDRNALKQLNGADFWDVYASLSREERRRFWRGIIKEIRFDSDKRIEVDFL